VKVVVAPDGFGGTLSPREAARAIADGWRDRRPGDEVVELPLADGGEGLLDVVQAPSDRRITTEVAGPLGHPIEADWLLRDDGSAVIDSSLACGLALVPETERTPMRATTYGVGQLLDAARGAGANRILVGLGGSATVDGGSGALLGLGFRLQVEDGAGLKIGGEDLHRVRCAERGRAASFDDVEVVLLSDVTTVLADAARVFGPQKGATPDDVAHLTRALLAWADVAERDLAGGERLRDREGTGAAGGLGFALACAIGARFVPGAQTVADLVDLPATLDGADLVVTGEGRLDTTSFQGKVVGTVVDVAGARDLPVFAVVGQVRDGGGRLAGVVAASPEGPGDDPAADVRAAAASLAAEMDERPR
jgi:glycerate 2-kinase